MRRLPVLSPSQRTESQFAHEPAPGTIWVLMLRTIGPFAVNVIEGMGGLGTVLRANCLLQTTTFAFPIRMLPKAAWGQETAGAARPSWNTSRFLARGVAGAIAGDYCSSPERGVRRGDGTEPQLANPQARSKRRRCPEYSLRLQYCSGYLFPNWERSDILLFGSGAVASGSTLTRLPNESDRDQGPPPILGKQT